MATTSDFKNGLCIKHNNDIFQILEFQHVKPGKGGAFNQVEMKSINKNTKLNERFRSSDNVERAIVEEIDYNYLYEDKDEFYFINNKTFELNNSGMHHRDFTYIEDVNNILDKLLKKKIKEKHVIFNICSLSSIFNSSSQKVALNSDSSLVSSSVNILHIVLISDKISRSSSLNP